MQRHHISNRALAIILVVAVAVMWLFHQPKNTGVPEQSLFRGHHVPGSVTDNVLMSDFQGLASQSAPIMPSRALGIFQLTSERQDQSMVCVRGDQATQDALVQELSSCAGMIAVNVTMRFQLLSAALMANDADQAKYQAERLEQAYTLLRVTDPQYDKPLNGWSGLNDAVKAGNLAQASDLLKQIFEGCAPCQGPDGEQFLKAHKTAQ